MASGDTLIVFTPQSNEPPATIYALLGLRNGHPTLEFDAATNWVAVFSGILPRNYAGGGLTINIHWMAATDTNAAHYCSWLAGFEADSAQDMDADDFAANQAAAGHPNGTSGIETITAIAFTDGAQMDSVTAGSLFRLKITRDAVGGVGTDDMTGNAQIVAVEIKET